MPDCAISTDVIAGFCGETEDEHQATVSIMKEVKYDMAYMFKYSERPKTLAERKYEDDVPEEVKTKRLQEIIDVQMQCAAERTKAHVGKIQKVLIEGTSKKSEAQYCGRNSHNVMVVFPKKDGYEPGQYVTVKMMDCTSVTLIGEVVES
jgi:tRNA-2-methylthio-N6-dimethylallyladenosine synthase